MTVTTNVEQVATNLGNDQLFASVDGIYVPLGGQECLFQVRATGECHAMTQQVFNAITLCRDFNTLDEHVANIASKIPGLSSQTNAVRPVLNHLISRGLMISQADVFNQLSEKDNNVEAVNTEIAGIAIRTCERPEHLERLLTSIRHYEAKLNVKRRYLIFDDSRELVNQEKNITLIKQYADDIDIYYFGVKWQQWFINELMQQFPQFADQIKWLLGSRPVGVFSGGRVWNFIQLVCAGYKYALFDDDILFKWRHFSTNENSLLKLSYRSNSRCSMGDSYDEIAAIGTKFVGDLIKLGFDACGLPIADFLQNKKNLSKKVGDLHLSDLHGVSSQSVIRTLIAGTYGNSPAASDLWLYLLDDQDIQQIWHNNNINQKNQHYVWRIADAYTLQPAISFTPNVIDASSLMPFTLPVGSGEDLIFNTLVHYCYPNDLALELPVATAHFRKEEKAVFSGQNKAMRPDFLRFLNDFIVPKVGQCEAKKPQQRLHILANMIKDLESAGEKKLQLLMREYLAFAQGDIIHQLQTKLNTSQELPDEWRKAANKVIEVNGQALINNQSIALSNWPEGLSDGDYIEKLRHSLSSVSKGLFAWPELWSACENKLAEFTEKAKQLNN